jgi:hypothetical protein
MTKNERIIDSFVLSALLRELTFLLTQVSFTPEKGCYEASDNWRVLVDLQPASIAGLFDAGVTVFPLINHGVDLNGIGIAAAGKSLERPNILTLRKLVTNKRGCVTFKDLPAGNYRLIGAKSLVAPAESLPAFRGTVSDFSNRPVAIGGSFTTVPALPLFREFKSEDDSLTCAIRETREGNLLLYFEASDLGDQKDLSVEYMLVDASTDAVLTTERDGKKLDLANQVPLAVSSEGTYKAQVNLGSGIRIPSKWFLRAYLVSGQGVTEVEINGAHGATTEAPRGSKFSGGYQRCVSDLEGKDRSIPGECLG